MKNSFCKKICKKILFRLTSVAKIFVFFLSIIFCSVFAKTSEANISVTNANQSTAALIEELKASRLALEQALQVVSLLRKQIQVHSVFKNEPLGNEVSGAGRMASRGFETRGGDLLVFAHVETFATWDGQTLEVEMLIDDKKVARTQRVALRKFEPELFFFSGLPISDVGPGYHMLRLAFGKATHTSADSALNVTLVELPRSSK